MKSVLVRMSSLFSDEDWSPAGAMHLDLSGLEGTTCYCDADSAAAIEAAFKSLPLNALHWIDGGDYHYLTDIWLRFLDRPAQLVLFDNHPDDQAPSFGGDILSCGGWVAHSRTHNPMLAEHSDRVYLSIDLDWLSPEYARTNWDQGNASLQDLLTGIDNALAGRELAGVDICGGITSLQGGTAEDFAINRRTRDILHDYFTAYSIHRRS